MPHSFAFNQDVPMETNHPGTGVLEITLTTPTGGAEFITFPKPYRRPPRIIGWTRQDAVASTIRISNFDVVSETQLSIVYDGLLPPSDVTFKIYALGEIAPS